jgi:hypothetical protein
MLSQLPSVDAVHAHSRAAETLMVPDPPCAGTLPLPLALRPHRGSVVGDVTVDEDEPQAAATNNDAQTIAPVMTRRGDDTLGSTVMVSDTQPRSCQESCHTAGMAPRHDGLKSRRISAPTAPPARRGWEGR